eukprot:NODE_371_length_9954_cov_0.100355.p2 type:complete len:537 gc:universal NODE_371_length_9954_cov_0.100355:6478-4868(-)
MKLNAQTTKLNMWSSNQIDEFSEQVKGDMVNFNSATTTLDSCIQIYSLRVDSLSENAHKLYQVFSASTTSSKSVNLEKKKKPPKKSGESYLAEAKSITLDTFESKGAWMMPLMEGRWSDTWAFNQFELQFNLDEPAKESVTDPPIPDLPNFAAKFNEYVHHEWGYLPSLSDFVEDNVPMEFKIKSEMGDMPFWYSEIQMEEIRSRYTTTKSIEQEESHNNDLNDMNGIDALITDLATSGLNDDYVEVDLGNRSHLIVGNDGDLALKEGASLIADASNNAELLWQANQNWTGPMHYKVIKPKREVVAVSKPTKSPVVGFKFVEHFKSSEATSGASLIKDSFIQLKSSTKSVVMVNSDDLLLPEMDYHYGSVQMSKNDFTKMEPFERIQLNRLWLLPMTINTKREDSKLNLKDEAGDNEEDLLASIGDYTLDSVPEYPVEPDNAMETSRPMLQPQLLPSFGSAITDVQVIKSELVESIHKQEDKEHIKLTEIVNRKAIERGDVQLSTLFVCLLHLAVENQWDLTTDDQNEVYVNSHAV